MDEIIAVTQLMEVTDDETHRDFYAELLVATLDELVPAIEEGRGTEGCTRSGSPVRCSPGYRRYLDAAHGVGAAGFVMNAFFENPVLHARYAEELDRWAGMLVATLERHFSIVAWSDTRFPHMPAKIAAGYLALGKILESSDPERAARYSEAFTDIIRFMATSAEANGGWIGADVSHARVSAAVMHLAYREEARGVLPVILTSAHLAGVGDGFEGPRTERGAFEVEGSLVGPHGVLVRHSSGIAEIVDDTYVIDAARRGTHTWARPFETLSALAIGHVTLLEP